MKRCGIRILEKLWLLTGAKRAEFLDSENLFFDSIGLNLFKNPECWGYWCTPTNTLSFATTSGDGVHFGFLCMEGLSLDESPIVMTLPSADTSNIIVGENLLDFLSLGCRNGYFELEQIEYQPELHIPIMDSQTYSEEATREEIKLLKAIESEFNLKPWGDHAKRLLELKNKYNDLLEYSDEFYELTT
ncbi:hypothetical protein I6F65_19655 [Pseudoalteromonas sp. SWXJZ94C]|uniref:hypothetical protein n=1 Tax=Pseudoalteromonas sp. SWXJZ94C TaxID=2792065 RepID=UPI0018CDE130|nr:hypothetical protein [Pseudoalteromonas sp. SWXJZ94C]MBH0059159.1 hypothetical protein [Pseudoalteromonas sp. SWXJZ94C]